MTWLQDGRHERAKDRSHTSTHPLIAGFFTPKMNENDTKIAAAKITIISLGAYVAEIALERWLTLAILAYTLAQFYFLVRDKWWRDRKRRAKLKRGECADTDAGTLE